MAGQRPLKPSILVRIQVGHQKNMILENEPPSQEDIVKAELEKEITKFLSESFRWQPKHDQLSVLEKLQLVERRLQEKIIEFIESELDRDSAEIDGGYGMNSSKRVYWGTFTIDMDQVDKLNEQVVLLKRTIAYLKRLANY
jgi:hypothetical protein